MNEQIATFTAFTSATPQQAQQYLSLTDGNVEQAVELFFNSPDLGNQPPAQPAPAAGRDDPITIDDDEDDVQMTGSSAPQGASFEDDEAMARRLQEEMYGSGGGGGAGGGMGDVDPETGVRAPMARTTETLVGPGSGDWRDDPEEMNAAIFEQMQRRRQGAASSSRAGIFNQREAPSIWANENEDDPGRRAAMSRATGGASDTSSKSTLLAQLFQPPFDLISRLPFSEARDEGKEEQKWIMVNVQDPSIFDCQVLNRDIWKNAQIKETLQEHFIFLQYNKDDPRGREYVQYYFANQRDMEDYYPHIAIVDPRTGEQVKTWSGSPVPKAADFLMDLHEFLDRYSLSFERKNPVQAKRKESKKDVGQMSEEEMLEMAMQNSLEKGPGRKEQDPDSLTKPTDEKLRQQSQPEALDTADMGPSTSSNGNTGVAAAAAKPETPFSRISATNPHTEPGPTDPDTTRIQFRYSGGRIVRRFALADPVRRIYEWLKAASPFEGQESKDFELICMGQNLIESLDATIAEVGLRNGTVMVEFVGGEDEEEGEGGE
ncbi:hypothetical protein KC327_g17321, partial [Hortaea werneckii]